MHYPPPVSWPVPKSPKARRVLWGVGGLFVGVPWYGWYVHYPWMHWLSLALLWAACSVWLVLYWRSFPEGTLRWDGKVWHWSPLAEPVQAVTLLYDFQTSVCVWLQPAHGAKFLLWLDADASRMTQWRAVRRALVSPARAPEPHGV